MPEAATRSRCRANPRHVVGYLRDFLFREEQARQPVSALRRRAQPAAAGQVLFTRRNLLVLDEPTNDLDIETLDLLEEMLADFEGTLLLVSHDRAFLDRLVTSTLVFEGRRPGCASMPAATLTGCGSGRRRARRRRRQPQPALRRTARRAVAVRSSLQRELDRLPARMARVEVEIAEAEERLADPALYPGTRPASSRGRDAGTAPRGISPRWRNGGSSSRDCARRREREGAGVGGSIAAAAYSAGRKVQDIRLEDSGEWAAKPGHFIWIGLHDPNEQELRQLQRQFGLHDLAVEDAPPPTSGRSSSITARLPSWCSAPHSCSRSRIEFGETQSSWAAATSDRPPRRLASLPHRHCTESEAERLARAGSSSTHSSTSWWTTTSSSSTSCEKEPEELEDTSSAAAGSRQQAASPLHRDMHDSAGGATTPRSASTSSFDLTDVVPAVPAVLPGHPRPRAALIERSTRSTSS